MFIIFNVFFGSWRRERKWKIYESQELPKSWAFSWEICVSDSLCSLKKKKKILKYPPKIICRKKYNCIFIKTVKKNSTYYNTIPVIIKTFENII